MVRDTNKKLGNDFENAFCVILYDAGFWVHRLNQNASGQPTDIIAVRDKRAFLIDCKVCSSDGFKFSRVEDNQRLSMKLWESRGNAQGWFAIKTCNDEIFMVPFVHIERAEKSSSKMSNKDLYDSELTLHEWLNIYAH